MKKVKIIYEVYEFKELSEEVKDKVIEKWYESEEYPFLEENLTESCKALLQENKVKYNGDLRLGYSLSYSKGDGLNFIGNFEWKKYHIKITHSWRYSSASSSDIIIMDEEGEEIDNEKISKQFEDIYLDICDKLEKEGYAEIEYRMDYNEFQEHCESNGYNFLKDGKMVNY